MERDLRAEFMGAAFVISLDGTRPEQQARVVDAVTDAYLAAARADHEKRVRALLEKKHRRMLAEVRALGSPDAGGDGEPSTQEFEREMRKVMVNPEWRLPKLPVRVLGRAREVVITDGGRGAGVDMGGGLVWLAAPSVDVVDAAGAGDALAGAYLASRLQGRDPVAALERGVAAAALSCESIGAALSYPNESAVDALVRRGVRRP